MTSPQWFQDLFGFNETKFSYDQVRSRFDLHTNAESGGGVKLSAPNGRTFHVGKFETPSVSYLQKMLAEQAPPTQHALGELRFDHLVGDASALHKDATLATNAVFQAASQFNCLEMVGPKVTPNKGITRYVNDGTQGPACAMTCAAGTVFRNYLVKEYGQGGPQGRQLDLLEDIGESLSNEESRYWNMSNGYALPASKDSLARLRQKIEHLEDADTIRDQLKVGVHWDTEVTFEDRPGHNVAQVYCSALPCSYAFDTKLQDWEAFARMVLNGAYEATLLVGAILAHQRGTRVKVYLTKLGGGVFGNDETWISDAINRALRICCMHPIDVYLVHYLSTECHYVESILQVK